MPPQIAILILQLLLEHGPAVAKKAQEILGKSEIPPDDWVTFWALIETPGETYFEKPVRE